MEQSLEEFTAGRSRSFASLLYALDDVVDTDGRPLGERRASSLAKDRVEIELKECPYHDARQGQPMNVSALKQVLAGLDSTIADIESIQRCLPGHLKGTSRMLCAVLHLLSGPATWLLSSGGDEARIPRRVAVGYKLAAGFFSAMRDYVAFGSDPHSVDAILAHVDERRLLFGASEVCAGPLPLITSATRALMHVPEGDGPTAANGAAHLACLLAAQVRIGSSWRSYDAHFERWLLCEHRDALTPRTVFLERELTRWEEDASLISVSPESLLPHDLAPVQAQFLGDHLSPATSSPGPWVEAVREVCPNELSAFVVESSQQSVVAESIAGFLANRARFLGVLYGLELEIRQSLSLSPASGFEPATLILPSGRAKRWVDAILGARVELIPGEPGEPATAVLRNHRGSMQFPSLS